MNNKIKDLKPVSLPERAFVEESHISGSNDLGDKTVRASEIRVSEDNMMTKKEIWA